MRKFKNINLIAFFLYFTNDEVEKLFQLGVLVTNLHNKNESLLLDQTGVQNCKEVT
jgi:hypothetical protein